ncbi:hypothetical protein O3G_MSEX004096 [Manduca sexta]|uniref:Peptidase S1 domain-containing protein n=1 Tax=Manduca sexta TaxID=7130 RepID=A0A921YV89_MANSE|nr:hypothetical protein O3G_MSEX004096 [Manduca sexta]KAG6445786.1 hypothetical protein O3G_MSEX004096 [Manduca sexta]
MKLEILLLAVAASVSAFPAEEPVLYYHKNVGMREAERIRQAEQAADFDGSRIFNGSPAALGAYPYMGGLVIAVPGGQSVCGSALLSNTRAVTAAHCWFDGWVQARQFEVVFGSVRLFSGGVRVRTSNVTMHPNWNTRNLNNDVAMIRFNRITFTNVIRPINLPTGAQLNNNFTGTWAQAAGFGRVGDNVGISPNQVLSHVTLQVITNAACRGVFPNNIIDSNLCTNPAANGGNVCSSDSGGPLSATIGGQRVLIGIVSFGSNRGCEARHPAAYARVTSFVPWIRGQM